MAQHPEKLSWKAAHPYGLSASQFGMALGFCGRVSDYVHYLRHIVGTEQEFKGNAYTDHGINTEPKSRALYELLTGCIVEDGGFFVTQDRILGCSPDGQIRLTAGVADSDAPQPKLASAYSITPPASRASFRTDNAQCCDLSCDPDVVELKSLRESQVCAVSVPFKSKHGLRSSCSSASQLNTSNPLKGDAGVTTGGRRASPRFESSGSSCNLASESLSVRTSLPCEGSSSSPSSPSGKSRTRLLEIKSPFRALYDIHKPQSRPFGIPVHYMCQIQGQLAIADCDECDFFVYLDHPRCQVEAWRVRRSRSFWAWAEPNLRQVSAWVKDGPPDWLNRSFAFPEFDCRTIEVTPLVFPFDISANEALTEVKRFPFFAQFESPYGALQHRRDAHTETPERFSSQDRCAVMGRAIWTELTEMERIAVALQTPAARSLFDANPSDAREGSDVDEERCMKLWGRLSSWKRALEEENKFEGSKTEIFWKSWAKTSAAGRDPLVPITLTVPTDWEMGQVFVRCALPQLPSVSLEGPPTVQCDAASLGIHQRLFFALLSRSNVDLGHGGNGFFPPRRGIHLPSSWAVAMDCLPVFRTSPGRSFRGTCDESESRRSMRKRDASGEEVSHERSTSSQP